MKGVRKMAGTIQEQQEKPEEARNETTAAEQNSKQKPDNTGAELPGAQR